MYIKKTIGERCFLGSIDIDDYPKYTEWANDIEHLIGMKLPARYISLEAGKKRLAKMASDKNTFSIIENKSNELIGFCFLGNIDELNQTGEIGIMLAKEKTNFGFGTEACTLLLDYAFNILNLFNVKLEVYDYNKQAIASYKKIGFKQVGAWRKAKLIFGKRYNQIIMDILADEYFQDN